MEKRPQPRQSRTFLITALVMLAFAAAGCMIPQVTFQRDAGVNAAFEGAVVLPDYDYYYSGPEAQPLAIIGIRHGYRFEQGFWKPVALTEGQLREWVWMIDTATRSTRVSYYGAKILAPDGTEIGIWYSFLDWGVAEVAPDGLVILYTPDNTSFDRARFGERRP
ncbi:MAG: hypothetical protein V1782_03130 [Pseudomonadota bacterium]